MGCRDLVLQSLPHGTLGEAVLVYSLLWQVLDEFFRSLACLLQKSCLQPQPRAPLPVLCVRMHSVVMQRKHLCAMDQQRPPLFPNWFSAGVGRQEQQQQGCSMSLQERGRNNPWKWLPFPWLSEELMVRGWKWGPLSTHRPRCAVKEDGKGSRC